MKILKMKLENFQGIKEFAFSPDGESCSIYGDNATGKSTVYNAFTWLMYGKASTGETGYTPQTKDSHHLHHVVELTVQLEDGSVTVLKKDYHEVYKTVRGSAQEIFAGNTSDYWVDGVPMKETQFKKVLQGIYMDENLAKMLTMYNYFLETMDVKERRKVLLEICGDADMDEVIKHEPELSGLMELLKKPGNTSAMYTVEEYQKIAAKEKSLTDKELKEIPAKINEAAKAKPDVAGIDRDSVDEAAGAIREKKRELESRRAATESAVLSDIKQQIARLELEKAEGERAHLKAETDKNRDAFTQVNMLQKTLSGIDAEIARLERNAKNAVADADRMQKQREQLLEEYQKELLTEWHGEETCPTCHQPLPAEQIEEARESFNVGKAKRLEALNRKGLSECSSAMIQEANDTAARLEVEIRAKREAREEVAETLSVAEKGVQETKDYSMTEACMDFDNRIGKLRAKADDLKAAALEADRELDGQIKELDAGLEEEMQKKALLDVAARQDARIEELESREKELAVQYEQLQRGIYLCELYTRTRASLLDERINSRFQTLKFRLFTEQKNGGIADDCEALIPCKTGMVEFKSANNASRVNAGLEAIDTLSEYYGVCLPVFADNAESVTHLRDTDAQVIRLVVSEPDKELRFEKNGKK